MAHQEKAYTELKKIAVDLAEGKIFTNLSVKDPSDLQVVFMPLMFMSEEHRKDMADNNIQLIYEYFSEAGPRGVNGMPNFFSMRMLSKKETDIMWPEYLKYVEMRKEFLEDYEPHIPETFVHQILTVDDLKDGDLK